MVNQQTLKGNWNEISGKIREKWGQLTDDDLQQFQGNAAQLVGFIQRKTGQASSEIERFLEAANENGAATMSRVAEKTQEYATQAVETARDAAEKVTERVREGYENAEKMVQSRPGVSVAAAFGAGLVGGVIVALLVRSR
jgi:uncharacterized protein YjbJ (UPF0337 family)